MTGTEYRVCFYGKNATFAKKQINNIQLKSASQCDRTAAAAKRSCFGNTAAVRTERNRDDVDVVPVEWNKRAFRSYLLFDRVGGKKENQKQKPLL